MIVQKELKRAQLFLEEKFHHQYEPNLQQIMVIPFFQVLVMKAMIHHLRNKE
jgi:hypothetical protein